jgi:ligand-binding SRPBCC domain-containing protein
MHHQHEENPAHGEEGHIHEAGEQEHEEAELTIDEPNMEVTAVLLKIRNQMAKLTWQRVIPQNTKMQAVSPAFEINRLFGLFGIGVTALQYFIDEQRFGPYSLWHHQHHFKTIDGGVEMTDIVHYKVPFWFLGDIANFIMVKSQLNKIFQYRFKAVEEKFGKFAGSVNEVVFG